MDPVHPDLHGCVVEAGAQERRAAKAYLLPRAGALRHPRYGGAHPLDPAPPQSSLENRGHGAWWLMRGA